MLRRKIVDLQEQVLIAESIIKKREQTISDIQDEFNRIYNLFLQEVENVGK